MKLKRSFKRLFCANKVRMIIYLLLTLLFVVAGSLFTYSLIKLNGIENTIRVIIIIFVILYLGYFIYKGYKFIVNKNKIKYIIISIITLILSIILLIISYYINIAYGAIGLMSQNDNLYYTGYLISLKDNANISKVGQISNKNDIEGYEVANQIIKDNKLDYEIISYDDYDDMIIDLYNKEVDAIFVQSNYVSYFQNDDDYQNIASETKIIYKKTIIKKNKNESNSNGTLNKPFTILLMGVDSTEDTIASANSFNGDTLMLVTFNPQTLNATMFSIPRDLYIPIACRNGASAKINTSSVGGMDCVEETIEDLIDIKIDYYARIDFKGVVDLVEALDGIDVNVTYPFCEQDSNRDYTNAICLKEGYQHLNGEEALAYARHRHTLPTGDLQRIQNQQLIVEAIAKKLLSLNTIIDFDNILKAISKNISTNLSENEILSSYNILKQMMLNVLSDKEPIVVSKAYLEVYDRRIYNAKKNTYSAALGYYERSLEEIIKALKVNLGLIEPTLITDFSFDANTPYEQTLIGKGLKNEVDNRAIPNFVGKSVSEAEYWGKENNITINKVMVNSSDEHYNSLIDDGLIGSQSIKAGTSLTNISSLTIYINVSDNKDSDEDIDTNQDEEPETNNDDDVLNDLFDLN